MFLVVGDMELEAYKKTKARNPFPANPTKKGGPGNPILISRREHVVLPVAGRPYTTRTKLGGKEREISIDLGGAGEREAKMVVGLDGKRVIHVKRLCWKFRGNEKVEVDGGARNCIIDNHREGAKVFHGDDICKKKTAELLRELGLPLGLLPLEDVEELGYHRESGRRSGSTISGPSSMVSYAAEVTAFVEQSKLKKITGVKTRELLLWLSVVEVYIDDPSSGKITFKIGTGLSDSFPTSAFDPEHTVSTSSSRCLATWCLVAGVRCSATGCLATGARQLAVWRPAPDDQELGYSVTQRPATRRPTSDPAPSDPTSGDPTPGNPTSGARFLALGDR
ncbi:hypothetical protein Taro_016821 [Colocasia esculenta]|uniref:Uncharacterized protein n=1 Tax=Colocasia esculenta TaxID=4460 RepID=A0A843UPL2_COLES|nr:hypothetical protein [Colocasia esculenta]